MAHTHTHTHTSTVRSWSTQVNDLASKFVLWTIPMLPVLILRISNSPTSSNVKMILKKDMFWGETYDQAYPVLKVFIPYAPCIVYLPTLSWFVKKMCANVQVSMILSKFKVPTHPLKVKKYWGGRRHFSMFARQRWYRLEIWRVDYMMCGLHMHFKGCNSHMNSRAEAVYLLNLSGIFPADQVWKVTIIPFSQSRHAAGRKKDHQITIPEPPQPHQRGGFQISSAAGMPSAAELFFFFFFRGGGGGWHTTQFWKDLYNVEHYHRCFKCSWYFGGKRGRETSQMRLFHTPWNPDPAMTQASLHGSSHLRIVLVFKFFFIRRTSIPLAGNPSAWNTPNSLFELCGGLKECSLFFPRDQRFVFWKLVVNRFWWRKWYSS